MPRGRRNIPDNTIHHVLNRGNKRQTIFHKPADYDAFFNLLGDTLDQAPLRVLAACLMPNHFHLVVWPKVGTDLSRFMQLLMNAHVQRHHRHYGTTGLGHIYQGRYKNFMVQDDGHLYRVLRYVEGNASRAGLVAQAELWRWSSLARTLTPHGCRYLSEWPVSRPENWCELVNLHPSAKELRQLRQSVKKGTPFGADSWVEAMVKRYGLESTVRTPGVKKLPPGLRVSYE